MKIRSAKIDDCDAITSLYKQLYDTEKVFDDNLINEYIIDDKQLKSIRKKIKSRKEIFLVAEMEQKIVGVIDGYIIDSIHYKEKVSFLEHLCVDKKYRKKRIATELIQEFSNKSKEKGATYVKLYAFEKNSNAIKLYNKLGFVESTILYNKKI